MTWPTKKLGEVLEYEQPTKYIVKSTNYKGEYKTPVLTAGKSFILGYTNERESVFPKEKLPVIIFDDFTTESKYVDFPFKVKSSAMKILHPRKDLVDPKFIFYRMQTINFIPTQHKRYWISVYSKFEIPLPPLSEQKRIVKKIEKLFAKIDEVERLRREAIEDTENLLKSAMQEVFERGKKWEIRKLKEVSKITSGGTPSRRRHAFYNGNIIWLKSGELNDNQNIEDSEEKITKEALENSNAKIFPPGTVLIAMYGATAGRLGILKKSASTNQAIAAIQVNKDELFNRFVFYFLLYFREELVRKSWGGAQPNLNQNMIKNLQIPLPPLSQQKQIVAYLDSLSKEIRQLKELQNQTAHELSLLRQSILDKAFKGELK